MHPFPSAIDFTAPSQKVSFLALPHSTNSTRLGLCCLRSLPGCHRHGHEVMAPGRYCAMLVNGPQAMLRDVRTTRLLCGPAEGGRSSFQGIRFSCPGDTTERTSLYQHVRTWLLHISVASPPEACINTTTQRGSSCLQLRLLQSRGSLVVAFDWIWPSWPLSVLALFLYLALLPGLLGSGATGLQDTPNWTEFS